MNKLQKAEQMRRALQMFVASLDDEKAVEVATVFPRYEIGKTYAVGEIIAADENSVGDPQLYRIVQAHTSQADWVPAVTPALYEPIGMDDKGFPVWSKPSGAHDAYDAGDVVNFNGVLKESTIDGNVYSPDEYPAGWKEYE